MAPLSVNEARSRILDDAVATEAETVELLSADRRVLAEDLKALRTQPPFDVSAMDGYAVRADDIKSFPSRLRVIGESAAGHGFHQEVESGQAVRIFTGAPVPAGTDTIIIQEDTTRDGDEVIINECVPEAGHIRQRGFDFQEGQPLITAGKMLTSRDITLAAAMEHASLHVHRKPTVGLIATGDELVLPGQPTGPDQIVCSNPFGIAAIVERAGGQAHFLGIAKDDRADLTALCERGRDMDVLVTIGGASVGDHDIVAPVLQDMGMSLDFWRIAMRPGKPLMFGRLAQTFVIGLPGNPVSSLICTWVFIVPLIMRLLGRADTALPSMSAKLSVPITANGPREHYMRGVARTEPDGTLSVAPVRSQDSSLLSPLAEADVLIVRPPLDPARAPGDQVSITRIDF